MRSQYLRQAAAAVRAHFIYSSCARALAECCVEKWMHNIGCTQRTLFAALCFVPCCHRVHWSMPHFRAHFRANWLSIFLLRIIRICQHHIFTYTITPCSARRCIARGVFVQMQMCNPAQRFMREFFGRADTHRMCVAPARQRDTHYI